MQGRRSEGKREGDEARGVLAPKFLTADVFYY